MWRKLQKSLHPTKGTEYTSRADASYLCMLLTTVDNNSRTYGLSLVA